MKLILLFIISSSLLSQSFLTFPNSIDLGNVSVGTLTIKHFEVKNETNDTFFIEKIKIVDEIPYSIFLKGNRINLEGNESLFRSFASESSNIIYPNQSFYVNFEIDSHYEDSISLSGGKLKAKIEFKYAKYGKDSLINHSFDVNFSCRIRKELFISNSGFIQDIHSCPNDEYSNSITRNLYLFNLQNGDAVLDSLKWWNGDTIVNFSGLMSNGIGTNDPKLINDSIPYKLQKNHSYNLSWFYKMLNLYDKKVFINAFITTFENKHFILSDSIEVRIHRKNEGVFQNNTFSTLKTKINQKTTNKNKFDIRGCSNNVLYLDSITFIDWQKDELQIYSDLGFPIRLDRGFNYSLSYDFTPKKTGETRGRIKAHFRDEAGNYFYRYCYLTTIVDDINDV
ncbi:MAG: hypothetical protein NTW25_07975, partial [Candidatus Kapabacteria bacterium]|nr:hypothetical protein [Candidatus Kapabacteria bacterium]